MQGSISDLSTSKNEFLVNADNLTEIETSIKNHPLFKESKREVEKLKISFSGEINGMELNKYLFDNNIVLSELVELKTSLEDEFLEIVKN